MAIPRFTPSDLGGQNFTHDPGSVATAIESSFYRAQENVRQNDESARADERLAMQQQDQAMRQEETAYQQTLRPLREQSMQLGVASQGLQLASQSVGLQSAQIGVQSEQIRLGQQQQEMQFLTGNLDWMSQQGQPQQQDSGSLTDRVKSFEGFNPSSYGDFKQTSIGYGTRAKDGETSIDESTASARLQDELSMHASNVDKAASKFGMSLSPSQRDALTSFDYNTGDAERVLERSGGDPEKVPAIMQEWRKAGGKVQPGLVKRRQAEAAWFQSGGTGVPSLSQVVSAKTPTGVPIVAAAANSLDPQAVIYQSFAPEQQQALNRFDQLTALSQSATTPQARSLAAQQVSLMQNDPRMVATLAQRQEMVKSTQAQVQVQGMLQSAPDDLVRGFESRYGGKYQISNIDGRQVPVNAQGQPLNSNDYASFSRAFTDYSTDYKYDPQAATSELRSYEAAIPKLAQLAAFQRQGPPTLQSFLAPGGGEPLTPQDGKAYESQLKAYNTALTDYNAQQQSMRQTTAELAIQAGRNPSIARAMATLFPAPQAGPAVAETPPVSETRPSLDQLATGRAPITDQEVADNDVWAELKTTLSKNLEMEGFVDNGDVSPDNAALQLAARIQKGDSTAIDKAAETFGKRMSDTLGVVGGEGFFQRQSLQPRQVARAWAEDVLIKYGYIDPKTKRPVKPGAAPAGATQTASGNSFRATR